MYKTNEKKLEIWQSQKVVKARTKIRSGAISGKMLLVRIIKLMLFFSAG